MDTKSQSIVVGLVEDDPMLSEMYKVKFQKEGFTVLSAADGAAGLELATKNKIDILLLDIIMPKLDGFQVLKELKAKGVKFPIVLLTNLGQEEDMIKGRSMGAADYFVKSNLTPDAITAKVKNILKKG